MSEPERVNLIYNTTAWAKIEHILEKIAKQNYGNLKEALHLMAESYCAAIEIHLDVNDTPFEGLAVFFDKKASGEETESFLKESLPAIAELALKGRELLPRDGIFYLNQRSSSSMVLNRQFVAALVALGFLCLHEEPHGQRTSLNFSEFLQPMFFVSKMPSQCTKLRFVLNYFARLYKQKYDLPGYITYRRLVLKSIFYSDYLKASTKPLCDVTIDEKHRIEDSGCHTLQMDFANEYIGGGVLGGGNVQEEIRFTICPELLASMLFMPRMLDNEAIIIQGFEQFSEYSNYGGKLQFKESVEDKSERDTSGDICTTLSAIDAIPYAFGSCDQYSRTNVLRDINKAYIGFLQPYLEPGYRETQHVNQRLSNKQEAKGDNDSETGYDKEAVESSQNSQEKRTDGISESETSGKEKEKGEEFPEKQSEEKMEAEPALESEQGAAMSEKSAGLVSKRPVATGNWGCGAFGGNPQFKVLLQWIAASEAECPRMIYYTFQEKQMKGFDTVLAHIREQNWTVGDLFHRIELISELKKDEMKKSVFEFILGQT